MLDRNCRTCGRDISSRPAQARWCSEACWISAYKQAHPGKHRATVGPHTCQRCGETFTGRKRKYCLACARPARGPRRCEQCDAQLPLRSPNHLCGRCKGTNADCMICGILFRRKDPAQRTCSRTCGAEMRRREGTDYRPGQCCPIPWRECYGCAQPFVATHGRRYCDACRTDYSRIHYRLHLREASLVPLETRVCAECGTLFQQQRSPGQGGRRSVYCSDRCSRRLQSRNRRHRKRTNGTKDNISLIVLAERDGNRCHLCGKHVKAADRTMDHLIPISYGGPHTWTNVALAHHPCNSRRGARGQAQLLLVG